MDATQFTQSGNGLALAGLVVLLLSRIGVSTDISTVLTVIGGIVALAGIIKQMYTHKELKAVSLAAGAIK